VPRFSLKAKVAIIVVAIVSAAAVGALVDRPKPRAPAPLVLPDPHYLVLLDQPESFADQLPPPAPGDERQVGFGVALRVLPTPLALMQAELTEALDKAEATGYPVLVWLDGWNHMFATTDPDLVEWTGFPEDDVSHGPLLTENCPPNLESETLRAEVQRRVAALATVVRKRSIAWREAGRGHLLAGVMCGWEDSSYVAPEDGRTGFAALWAQGLTAKSLRRLADAQGRPEDEVIDGFLQAAAHDYAALMARAVQDSGIPSERVYTHVGPWVRGGVNLHAPALNGYSRPGLMRPAGDIEALARELAETGHPQWAATDVPLEQDLLAGLSAGGARVTTVGDWDDDGVLVAREWLAN